MFDADCNCDVIQRTEPARLTNAPFDEWLHDVVKAEALKLIVEVGVHLAVHDLLADKPSQVLTQFGVRNFFSDAPKTVNEVPFADGEYHRQAVEELTA